jgi:hypothetical protein
MYAAMHNPSSPLCCIATTRHPPLSDLTVVALAIPGWELGLRAIVLSANIPGTGAITMRRLKTEGADKANPKLNPNPPTNTEKEPDEWVSGDDPMTGAQASYLKTLAEEAGDPDAYDENLTKAEASKRIETLKEDLGLE